MHSELVERNVTYFCTMFGYFCQMIAYYDLPRVGTLGITKLRQNIPCLASAILITWNPLSLLALGLVKVLVNGERDPHTVD